LYDNKFRNYFDSVLAGGAKLLVRVELDDPGSLPSDTPQLLALLAQYRDAYGEESASVEGGTLDLLRVLKLGTVESLNFAVYKLMQGYVRACGVAMLFFVWSVIIGVLVLSSVPGRVHEVLV